MALWHFAHPTAGGHYKPRRLPGFASIVRWPCVSHCARPRRRPVDNARCAFPLPSLDMVSPLASFVRGAFLPLVFKGARGSAPGPATPANFQHATRKQAHVPAETSAGGLPMRGRVCVRALPGHIPQHTCRLRSRDQPRAVLALRKTPASGE